MKLSVPRVLRIARWPLAIAVMIYLAAAGYMAMYQRSFLYRTAPAWIPSGGQGIPRAQDMTFSAPDGVTLRGWRVPAAREDALTYIYFHGNAKGLDDRAKRFRLMTADGSGLVAMSYRGYGGSGGVPSEAALLADAKAIYDDVRRSVPETRIVLFGESLGSGVAVDLVTRTQPRAVILDSPYLSVLTRAQAAYPWLPVSLILRDPFRSDLKIGAASSPIFIMHGSADRTIPPTDSEKLAALAKPGTITRKLYPGEPHVVPYDRGPDNDIPAFLARIARQ